MSNKDINLCCDDCKADISKEFNLTILMMTDANSHSAVDYIIDLAGKLKVDLEATRNEAEVEYHE